MRYASLSRPSFTITRTSLNKPQARSKATRIMTVFPTMYMQNLYEKFYNKEKRVIPTSSKQHATRQNLGHAVFERFGFIRCPKLRSSLSSKSIAQGLTVQQQRHVKSIKHGALPDICIDDVRRHTMSPVDPVVAVKTPARFRTFDHPVTHRAIGSQNKV